MFVLKGISESRKKQIGKLERDIRSHKEVIRDAFLTEIQIGVTKANDTLDLMHIRSEQQVEEGEKTNKAVSDLSDRVRTLEERSRPKVGIGTLGRQIKSPEGLDTLDGRVRLPPIDATIAEIDAFLEKAARVPA